MKKTLLLIKICVYYKSYLTVSKNNKNVVVFNTILEFFKSESSVIFDIV